MSISRSSLSSQRVSTTQNKDISFRLFSSDTHQEIYHFFEVPRNIAIEIMGLAMQNEFEEQPSNIPYATVLIGASFSDLPIEAAREMIKDLQQKINPSKQRYRIQYEGWAKRFQKGSVYQHHENMDGTNDAWVTQLNSGDYTKSYKENRAKKFQFTAGP